MLLRAGKRGIQPPLFAPTDSTHKKNIKLIIRAKVDSDHASLEETSYFGQLQDTTLTINGVGCADT